MDKIGVLITNLGTPDAPDRVAIRRYLKEFLNDVRVVEPPPARWIWKLILNLIILNIRPQKIAIAYKTIWGKFGKGSPLLDISISQRDKLRKVLGDNYLVEIGMRYGNPSIDSCIKKLKNCKKIIVLPLYPQYSASTTGSTFDALSDAVKKLRVVPEINFINSYYKNPLYIKALASSVKDFWAQHGKADLLLISYHGLPKRYAKQGDIYPAECGNTSKLLVKELGLKKGEFKTTYQSRFGREPWLKLYTDETLKLLPKRGIKTIQVICPGFSSDCLETLEEIKEENKAYFLGAGGKSFDYIDALNDSDNHIKLLSSIIKNN